MSRIRRLATAAALVGATVLGACSSQGGITEPQAPDGGASFDSQINNVQPPPPPENYTTQTDSTGRCTGQAGSAGGRC